MLDRAGYERNSKKEFHVPTMYIYPIKTSIASDDTWSNEDVEECMGI